MPSLIIIAGCNGAGKSVFAPSFLPNGLQSFDFDKVKLDYYNSLSDSPFREKFAHDYASEQFETSIKQALKDKRDFCYETNFDSEPFYWPSLFKENGYEIGIIFFCLESQEIARNRIQIRTEFSGHFVNNHDIDLKWKAGYKNFNQYFAQFHNVLIVDNSIENAPLTFILSMNSTSIELLSEVPHYFQERLPSIFEKI